MAVRSRPSETTDNSLTEPELDNLRLLVVEDDGLNRFYLSKVLGRAGAAVSLAESGESAVEFCSGDDKFDLILMDVGLPGINGVEAARRILGDCPEQRIVLLTAHTSDSDMEEYRKLSLKGILGKPVKEDDLIAYISSVLAPE